MPEQIIRKDQQSHPQQTKNTTITRLGPLNDITNNHNIHNIPSPSSNNQLSLDMAHVGTTDTRHTFYQRSINITIFHACNESPPSAHHCNSIFHFVVHHVNMYPSISDPTTRCCWWRTRKNEGRRQQPYCLLACLKSQNGWGDRFPFQAGGGALSPHMNITMLLTSIASVSPSSPFSPIFFVSHHVMLLPLLSLTCSSEDTAAP